MVVLLENTDGPGKGHWPWGCLVHTEQCSNQDVLHNIGEHWGTPMVQEHNLGGSDDCEVCLQQTTSKSNTCLS